MIDHSLIKLIHISCVTLTITGFVFRAGLMLIDSPLRQQKWLKTSPHYVDATLLFSGIWMAFNISQYPFTAPWLTAKLLALIGYILLGVLAFRGKTSTIRRVSLVLALVTFSYMLSVALTRTPTPWL